MNVQSMNNRLVSKVAIVTGGGSGIGEAICRLFARQGARVAVTDINEPTATRVANEIKEEGNEAMAAKVDVTSKEEIYKVIKDVLACWSKIDILVNNAGVTESNWFTESDEHVWDMQISVNLRGIILFSHAVLPTMIEHKQGKIINIASVAGKIGLATGVVYSATKGGVIAFTKALAKEVARYGILVNDICPGFIDTPMRSFVHGVTPKVMEKTLDAVPLKRLGRPEELAAAALFLASDESSFITGHSLVVDGGFTMG